MLYPEEDWCAEIVDKLGWSDRLRVRPPQPLLCHYTGLEKFRKIVEGKIVHLNRLDRMNDSEEGKWLSSHLRRAGRGDYNLLPTIFSPLVQAATFAFCLSEDHDLLSQWQAYANGGRGLAIGFDHVELAEACKPSLTMDWMPIVTADYTPQTTFCNVEYLSTSEMQGVAEQIRASIRKFEEQLQSSWNEQHPPGSRNHGRITHRFKDAGWKMGHIIRQLNTIYKNSAFFQEKEWRIIFYEGRQKSGNGYNEEQLMNGSNLDFRFTENDVLRHYTLSVKDAIKAISIGPLCKAEPSAIRGYLAKNGVMTSDISQSSATLQAL